MADHTDDDIGAIAAKLGYATISSEEEMLAYCAKHEFIALCASKNKRYTLVPNDNPLHSVLEQWRRQVAGRVSIGRKAGKPMRLHIGFIHEPTFKAWSASPGEVDFIAVNEGLYYGMTGVCRALLSHPYLFPDVGNASICTPFSIDDARVMFPETFHEWEVEPLECPEREALAMRVADLGMKLVIEHEFIHLANGHIDFIEAERAVQRSDETSKGISALTWQTLEWDADAVSLEMMLFGTLAPAMVPANPAHRWVLPDPGPNGPLFRVLEMITVAAAVFHAMQADPATLLLPEDRPLGHPPPLHRVFSVTAQIDAVLHFRCGIEPGPINELTGNAMVALFMSLSAILPNWASLKGGWDRAMTVQLAELYTEEWARIRPQLDELKRGGSLPPAVPYTKPFE